MPFTAKMIRVTLRYEKEYLVPVQNKLLHECFFPDADICKDLWGVINSYHGSFQLAYLNVLPECYLVLLETKENADLLQSMKDKLQDLFNAYQHLFINKAHLTCILDRLLTLRCYTVIASTDFKPIKTLYPFGSCLMSYRSGVDRETFFVYQRWSKEKDLPFSIMATKAKNRKIHSNYIMPFCLDSILERINSLKNKPQEEIEQVFWSLHLAPRKQQQYKIRFDMKPRCIVLFKHVQVEHCLTKLTDKVKYI